jgi:4-hydroxybenzoyl-CoA reductase subunit beta
MLSLRPFSLLQPQNLDELREHLALADDKTKIIAGGTDLLPNLKHGLYAVDRLIALKQVKELEKFACTDDSLTLGPLLKLSYIANSSEIKRLCPALSLAASVIASPPIRAMGTVGGNVCLDTRCSYFNQTEFWRKALGYCLKKDGCECHVVKTGKRCVAASSNDLATVLLAYDAEVSILGAESARLLKLENFYTAHGEKNNILAPGEIVSGVSIALGPHVYGGFAKLRHRQSFDFPLLSIGVAFVLNEERVLVSGRLVVNALVAKAKVFDLSNFKGNRYSESLIEEIAHFAMEKCHPQSNMAEDVAWRKEMIELYTKRAFNNAHLCKD